MYWKNEGQFYEGNWENDQLSGFGTYIYISEVNGMKMRNYYIGHFKENNRDGFGLHFYSD